MIVRLLYSIFLAVLLVTFVGVGIAAFYKGPKPPEYPTSINYLESQPTTSSSAQIIAINQEYDKKQKDYVVKNEKYNKNVSTIAIAAALIIIVTTISILSEISYLSDGLLLGSVLTLGYAIIRGFGSGDEMFRFVVVTIGLIAVVFLGYWKFTRTQKAVKK